MRWLLAVRGLSVIVASVAAAVIGLGLIDYMVRFRDRGVLVIFAACVLGLFGWMVYRFLGRLHKLRLGDTELALQIEACFPQVEDRLASAVEFLKQPENDARAGSAAMRRAAIAQAAAECDEIDFAAALNLRPAFHAAAGTFAVCLAAAVLVVLNPLAVRIALARLALPLGKDVWPQKTHLKVKDPVERIARGQTLVVEVVDAQGARLPANCRIHYRFRDAQGKLIEEGKDGEPMLPLGQALVARREKLACPLEFRVTGGDDQSMPWMPVDVLEPPAVAALRVTVSPPAYTNWPDETHDATSILPVLAGSRVRIWGEATKPLRSAVLRLDGGRELPTQVDADGRKFSVEGLALDKSTAYTFKLVDSDGISGGDDVWQFFVQADLPPSVVIQQPKSNLFVTPRARIDLRVDAHDDLALQRVMLVRSSSGAAALGDTTVPLYPGPAQAAGRADPRSQRNAGGQRKIIDYRLDMEELKLQPGTQLTVYAAATDYRGQTGRSDPRVFSVVTAEELQERLAARVSQIVAELARLLDLQRDARERVRSLQSGLHEARGLKQADVDRLQSVEFNQREVVRGLTDGSDGLRVMVRGVLADLKTNRVDNLDFQRRMQGLVAEFDRLQREHFPPIGMELTAAVKGLQLRLQSPGGAAGGDAENEGHLTRAGDHQQQVVEALENMRSELRQWDDYRRFQREVAQLLRDQEEVARNTAVLGRQTLSRDVNVSELSPQEAAELKVLAERQFELARRENRLEEEMERTVPILRASEPLAADTLGDALAEARRLAVAATMHAVGGKIRNNDLGLAPADHQKILQDLQDVLDILANNRSQEVARVVARKLDEAAHDLDGLRKRQADLRGKFDDLARAVKATNHPSDKQKADLRGLAREQDEVRQEALRMARRLERLLAQEAARSAAKAGEEMDQASRAGNNGDTAGASRSAKDAEQTLGDSARQLEEHCFALRLQQEIEQQARLEDAVKHLHRQEERIAEETQEFAGLERSGPLSRAQVFGLLELARQQSLLREETDRLWQSLDATNAFRLGLSAAAEEMRSAAASLQEQQVGTATQQAEQTALARLGLLLTALAPEDKDKAAQDGNADNGGNGGAGGKPQGSNPDAQPNGVIMLAQLKFLKLWQEDLNRRTQQLELDAANKPPAAFRERYARLADDQGRLAAAALLLLGPGDGKKENGP